MDHRTYWQTQRRRIALLLGIWFVAGPLMSILFIEQLNQIVVMGTPFGFWMAQQGSILVFVILIFVYAVWAGRLDRRAGVAEATGENGSSGAAGEPAAPESSGASGASGDVDASGDAEPDGSDRTPHQ